VIDTKDWLTSGPQASYIPPLLGVKFICLKDSFEIIGEIVQVIDSVATVKDPIGVGRDSKSLTKFNFIKLKQMNPIIGDEIQIPITSMLFLCKPDDHFIKNYTAARSGLVTAVALPNGGNVR
jgi:hypothetical protein